MVISLSGQKFRSNKCKSASSHLNKWKLPSYLALIGYAEPHIHHIKLFAFHLFSSKSLIYCDRSAINSRSVSVSQDKKTPRTGVFSSAADLLLHLHCGII